MDPWHMYLSTCYLSLNLRHINTLYSLFYTFIPICVIISVTKTGKSPISLRRLLCLTCIEISCLDPLLIHCHVSFAALGFTTPRYVYVVPNLRLWYVSAYTLDVNDEGPQWGPMQHFHDSIPPTPPPQGPKEKHLTNTNHTHNVC